MRFPFVLRSRHEAALRRSLNVAGVAFLTELDAALTSAENETLAAIFRNHGSREALRAEGASKAFRAAHRVAQKLMAVEQAKAEAEK